MTMKDDRFWILSQKKLISSVGRTVLILMNSCFAMLCRAGFCRHKFCSEIVAQIEKSGHWIMPQILPISISLFPHYRWSSARLRVHLGPASQQPSRQLDRQQQQTGIVRVFVAWLKMHRWQRRSWVLDKTMDLSSCHTSTIFQESRNLMVHYYGTANEESQALIGFCHAGCPKFTTTRPLPVELCPCYFRCNCGVSPTLCPPLQVNIW